MLAALRNPVLKTTSFHSNPHKLLSSMLHLLMQCHASADCGDRPWTLTYVSAAKAEEL
jgi:hypothetical protein